ncbi:hypothetical protein P12x_001395 [Tundrisphaera lichenicola]|uniref:hypothetical protein n=1 Tax=Tundrisphaera lichenicola TaxID=2029860 RepID=UPI003EBD47EE
MLLTHRFGSAETLDRARFWLNHHGIEVASTNTSNHDASRMAINVDLPRASAALALIDSIERSDPEGWPGLLDRTRAIHADEANPSRDDGSGPASTPIHWEARKDHPSSDPLCCKICEYMLSRWE